MGLIRQSASGAVGSLPGIGTIRNSELPPAADASEVSIADAEATEGVGATMDFVVTLDPAETALVTVGYRTTNIGVEYTATTSDYTSTNGTLTFEPGETTKTVSVPILAADVEDDGETFLLYLENLAGVQDGGGGVGTIRDPGAADASELSVADAEATEEEDTTLDFVVTLDPAATATVTVDYATAAGTATAGDDYTGTNGTLTFAAGDTTKTVSVPITDDTADDGGETLTLTLSNASGAEIADAEATGTIRNTEAADPDPLTASFSGVPAEHDGDSAFTFRVEFSEDVGISDKTLRDESFSETEGDVTGARRVDGRHDLWEITVEPDGDEAVTITLGGGRDCGTTGAVCTRGDNPTPLSNSPSATVAGPDEDQAATNTAATGAPTISGTPQVGETPDGVGVGHFRR